ncbi:uncharacterized protein EI90DRAFT_2902427 [Cantharellus anzutake]|uniref:uncharacterized protein n=1 Tax=Cantharellus anzutake TaxID=1750568 RepID=UPI0019086143|nr:uncharacterized protein EI90DRAFT_2902427 [Cantharellus anzutake]KAF8344045.1 hypothetical protein EI90DRAFT_2902427 [Cantharellus anzutake]
MESVGNEWWPWDSEGEWEVVRWLSTMGISKGAINKFLNLKYVYRPFSFGSANTMYGKVKSMLGVLGWHEETIVMDDAPLEPQEWWC